MAGMRVNAQRYLQRPVGELTPHPMNPRQGDVGAIHTSIEANGFYGALVVQKTTGFVIAGNHRLEAARAAGAVKVPVLELDVDDATALRILLADNRTNDLASYDNEALRQVLVGIADGEDALGLQGTGWDGDDLDTLIKDLDEPFIPPADPKPPSSSTIVGKRTCPECGHTWIEGEKPVSE